MILDVLNVALKSFYKFYNFGQDLDSQFRQEIQDIYHKSTPVISN